MTNSTFHSDGYRDAASGQKAAAVELGVLGQEYMSGYNEGLRDTLAKAARTLAGIQSSRLDLFARLPGDLFIQATIGGTESISNEYELHTYDSEAGEEGNNEGAILMVFGLAALDSSEKPQASLSMDNHLQEAGVNDRYWINLTDDAELVAADFAREASAWDIPASRIEKGVEYIAKCCAAVVELGDQIIPCQGRS